MLIKVYYEIDQNMSFLSISCLWKKNSFYILYMPYLSCLNTLRITSRKLKNWLMFKQKNKIGCRNSSVTYVEKRVCN